MRYLKLAILGTTDGTEDVVDEAVVVTEDELAVKPEVVRNDDVLVVELLADAVPAMDVLLAGLLLDEEDRVVDN